MSKAHHLEAEFRTLKNTRGGILMLTADEACRLIARAEEERIRVLGIDSFVLQDDNTRPLLEHSVDYSERDFVADSNWRTAETFINERASLGFHFEIVLGDAIKITETLQELIGARGFERVRQGLEARFGAHRLVYKIHYGETPPNSSLFLRLESKDRIGEVCAWESGDCDVQLAEFQKTEAPKCRHQQLKSGDDFHDRIAEVFRFVTKRQFPHEL